MNDLIERITNAIFHQEGMSSSNFNPGNLRFAPWLQHPIILNGFWAPASRAEGVAGAAHCVALRIAEGQTLAQLISGWAPVSDGNATATYISNVKWWAGIPDEHVPLWNYLAA